MHDHYRTTTLDPDCNLCQLAQATRPLEVAAPSKLELVAAAQRMRAEGQSLYAIATTLGVTKEWLREYAL